MQSVSDVAFAVKPEVVIGEMAPAKSEAWRWGYEDGQRGESVYTGLDYFVLGGRKWRQYEAGHKAGTQARAWRAMATAHVMPEDFAGALVEVEQNGIVYCLPLDIEAIENDWIGD